MTLIRRETHEFARVFMVLTASVFYQGTIAKREQKLVNVFHPKPIPRVRLVSLDSSFRRVRLLYSPFSDRRSIAFQEHVSTFLSLTLSTRTENSAGLTSFQGGFYNETHMMKSTGADIDCRQSGPCSIRRF